MDSKVPNFLEETEQQEENEQVFEEGFSSKDSDNLYVKNEDASILENNQEERLKYIKAMAPEYKADAVYKRMLQEGRAPISGQPKRRLVRFLEREAKKGRLDKYFL